MVDVKRKAVIDGTFVENVILADDDFELPDRLLLTLPEGSTVAPGWTYDGEDFAPPVPTTPIVMEVTMRQARLALLYAGLGAQVDAAIDALPEPQKSATRIEWDFAKTLRRDHAMVPMLAAALSLTEEDLDILFYEASQIV
ncbi:MAG: hypothetical protein M9955_13515 [Rhizobiaceae bacterium]|nr:hypothetical protein [Rhizobiaceae bacterium]